MVLSFSWGLMEGVEGWVGGRSVQSLMVTSGERASVCVWVVWSSLEFLAGFRWSSEVVLFGSSGSEELWSGGSVGE